MYPNSVSLHKAVIILPHNTNPRRAAGVIFSIRIPFASGDVIPRRYVMELKAYQSNQLYIPGTINRKNKKDPMIFSDSPRDSSKDLLPDRFRKLPARRLAV